MNIDSKINHVKELLLNHRVIIALSGGVDSSVLAKISYDLLGENTLAVTLSSEVMAASEIDSARQMASLIGINHTIIPVSILANHRFLSNQTDRCYHCKRHLFMFLLDYAREHGYTMVIDGSNASDQGDYRPGQRALQEMNIVSPFQIYGLNKEEIRELARGYGLINWNRASNACLASRIPYGIPITQAILSRVETGENLLHNMGFTNCRLRHHGEIARIEIPPSIIETLLLNNNRETIINNRKTLG